MCFWGLFSRCNQGQGFGGHRWVRDGCGCGEVALGSLGFGGWAWDRVCDSMI